MPLAAGRSHHVADDTVLIRPTRINAVGRHDEARHLSLNDLLSAPSEEQRGYPEVLRVAALSAGVYKLAAGSEDLQSPHSEDEVYVVLRGRARVTVGAELVTVAPGSFLYVPAGVPHQFHDIEEDLAVLVVFSPPEGTAAADGW